jgi:hypothetical protein
MGARPRLRIDDLLAAAPVDPEAHLDAALVERYARTLGTYSQILPQMGGETASAMDAALSRTRPGVEAGSRERADAYRDG